MNELTVNDVLNKVCDFLCEHANEYAYVNNVTGEAEVMALEMFKHMYYSIIPEM